jgi:Ca2+-transporting ATPase
MSADTPWHSLSIEEAHARQSSGATGLATAEAMRRLTEVGPNELIAEKRVSPWRLLLEQFKNVLILVLLAATGLSVALGHGLESLVIAVIVLFAVLLGFVQEFRAERALEALRKLTAPEATVIRDGVEQRLPARQLVPGDVVELAAGDKIPADGRVLYSARLSIDEAVLTGESVAVEKTTATLAGAELPVADRSNMAHAGTAVTSGRGTMLIVATGMSTEFGKLAQLLHAVESTKTPLQKSLDRVGSVLARVAGVLVTCIVIAGLLRGQSFIDMFIFGIALAVAVVPEALPAVVTISLALGVQRMAKRNALVRRLPAVETLGSTTFICTDKTGTLTQGEMTARRIFVDFETLDVSGSGYSPEGQISRGDQSVEPSPPLQALLEAGVLSSDARLERLPDSSGGGFSIRGDPTEGALVVLAAKRGLDKATLEAEQPRRAEIPFSSETKRMTTLHDRFSGTIAFSKGAPEVILASCQAALAAQGEVPLDDARRASILQAAQSFATDALRVLALAKKENARLEDNASGEVFLGLVGLMDPPRPEAAPAIAQCKAAGIRPVMITGDHPDTARAIARELDLMGDGRVVLGTQVEAWTEEQLENEVEHIDVFARLSPLHKLRIVGALQTRGQIVAMTGDGVNDAPALRKADIGIAMGRSGTEVAREAAAMTLRDDSFATVVAAVDEGRRVYGNIKKYLMYLLSSNIGEIGLMGGAALFGLPLPLSAVQILYVNLATDGLPALALAVDPPEPDLMLRRPRDPKVGMFTRPTVALMAVGGVWSTIVNVSLFAWAQSQNQTLAHAMTMTFVSLVLIQFLKAYAYRSDRHTAFVAPFSNRWLNLAVGWELALLVGLIHVPFLQSLFATVALTPADWLLVTGSAATIVPVLELAKWLARRGVFGRLD